MQNREGCGDINAEIVIRQRLLSLHHKIQHGERRRQYRVIVKGDLNIPDTGKASALNKKHSLSYLNPPIVKIKG